MTEPQLPQPERICIFGTDGTNLITEGTLEILKDEYFPKLDESRKDFDYPLRYEDYQQKNKNTLFQDTTWVENAVANSINRDQFTMFIRYNKLNAILCTIDGTFTQSRNITLLVRWNANTVSLFNEGYTYESNNQLDLAALSFAIAAENPVSKHEIIQLGKKESYAAYRIVYDNRYQVFTSKNPDCRLHKNFNTKMPLVELKCVEKGTDFKLGPARRLKCFTDIPTKKVEYQKKQKNGRDCFTNLKYTNVKLSNTRAADHRDHYFVKSLSMVLDERKNDEDKVVTICFWRQPKATTEAGSIYIYDMMSSATDSPQQRASRRPTFSGLHEGKHLIDILPFYRR